MVQFHIQLGTAALVLTFGLATSACAEVPQYYSAPPSWTILQPSTQTTMPTSAPQPTATPPAGIMSAPMPQSTALTDSPPVPAPTPLPPPSAQPACGAAPPSEGIHYWMSVHHKLDPDKTSGFPLNPLTSYSNWVVNGQFGTWLHAENEDSPEKNSFVLQETWYCADAKWRLHSITWKQQQSSHEYFHEKYEASNEGVIAFGATCPSVSAKASLEMFRVFSVENGDGSNDDSKTEQRSYLATMTDSVINSQLDKTLKDIDAEAEEPHPSSGIKKLTHHIVGNCFLGAGEEIWTQQFASLHESETMNANGVLLSDVHEQTLDTEYFDATGKQYGAYLEGSLDRKYSAPGKIVEESASGVTGQFGPAGANETSYERAESYDESTGALISLSVEASDGIAAPQVLQFNWTADGAAVAPITAAAVSNYDAIRSVIENSGIFWQGDWPTLSVQQ